MTLAFYRQKISQSLFFQKPLSLSVTHCISTKICLVAKKEVAKEKQNATVIADSPCFLFIMHYVSLFHNPIIMQLATKPKICTILL